ncbi:MAG: phasin family protein, partial [Burkholderiaceae bacterium]
MVKKKTAAEKSASPAGTVFGTGLPEGLKQGLLDGSLAQNVRDSAQQIWAAGLGAFAKAQGEGGKVFDALVSEGVKLQKKTQSAAEEKLTAVASKVNDMTGGKAGQQWDRLESIFEDRVSKALKRLGVPSAQQVQALQARVDELSAALQAARKDAAGQSGALNTAAKAAAKTAAKAAAKTAATALAKPAAKTAVKAAA